MYVITVFIFSICIIIGVQIRARVDAYHRETQVAIKNDQWNFIRSHIVASQATTKYVLNQDVKELKEDMIENLDFDELRDALSNNKYYKPFDDMLKSYFETNVYTKNGMDAARNSIFIMVNGNIIASYGHDQITADPSYDKTTLEFQNNSLYDIINKQFYNTSLSLHAYSQLLTQESSNLIIWQQSGPSDRSLPIYSTITMEDLENVYKKYGLDALGNYEILNAVYINDYTNIFGEDDNQSNAMNSDKIVIVQKFNIKDYLNTYSIKPDPKDIDKIEREYTHANMSIGLLEILLYIVITLVIIWAVRGINHEINEYVAYRDDNRIKHIDDDNASDEKDNE